jgi:hypothetical protein
MSQGLTFIGRTTGADDGPRRLRSRMIRVSMPRLDLVQVTEEPGSLFALDGR